MLTRQFIRFLAAIVALFGVTASAAAQLQQVGSRIGDPEAFFDGSDAAYLEERLSNYDMQLFRPVDFGEQSVKERFDNYGLFLTYDRVSLYSSAPSSTTVAGQSSPSFNYATWGNRFEAGYMSEEDSGVTATLTYSNGSTFIGGGTFGTPLPELVSTRYASFELNKTYRQKLKNGATFEPYFGFRYVGLNDKTLQDGSVIATNPFFPTGIANRFEQHAENRMPGGQIGFRLFRNTGRFTLSTNASALALYNVQNYRASDVIARTNLENISIDRAIDGDSFVPAVDLRLDVAYHITRDLSLRAGGEVVYMASGITRANILQMAVNPNSIQSGTPITNALQTFSDESSTMAGFSFGVEWRR